MITTKFKGSSLTLGKGHDSNKVAQQGRMSPAYKALPVIESTRVVALKPPTTVGAVYGKCFTSFSNDALLFCMCGSTYNPMVKSNDS